jgi:hypothetical protein
MKLEDWDYQLRINLSKNASQKYRNYQLDSTVEELSNIIKKHDATLKCQYDAFQDYVNEAESMGVDKYHLYKWTKATIEDPLKKEKYLKSFYIYIKGEHVYNKEKADLLENDLKQKKTSRLYFRYK